MAKKRNSSTIKVKKKKWYPIYASEQFNNALLGETYINDEAELSTKYLTANLSTVTRSMRKQNINVQFKVDRVEDGKAYTKIVGYAMINAAIKRLVRRGRDKISDSFLAKTKSKEVLRIKPLIVTGNKGTKALQSAIRLESRRVIREFVFTKDANEVFGEAVEGKLQKLMKESVAKLSPVRSCEIRMIKIDDNTKVVVTDDGVKTEKVTIRKREKSNQLEEPKAEVAQADEAEATETSGDEDDSEDASEEVVEEVEDEAEVEETPVEAKAEATKAETKKE